MKRMRRNRSVHDAFRPRAMCLALALAFGSPAHGNPTGAAVVSGSATITQHGSTLSVTNTPNAIINWQSFSIGAAETTRFIQQSASSAVLNRVVGIDPSVILGTLQSNGRVFLINPSGVMFGQGARIDVAGLVASTLNISDQDFLAGRLNFVGDAGAGSIVNSGTITTPSGGSVYLVASNVENNGVITAPNGEIILAAGQSVLLGDTGAPNVFVEVRAPESTAVNINEIMSSGGSANVHSGLIRQNGVVRADSVGVNAAGKIVFKSSKDVTLTAGSTTSASGGTGGTVQIQAAGGTNTVRGTVAATGSVSHGGNVQLLGNQVGLAGNATVDASGKTGGGTILVGGDYKGGNRKVQNAAATVIESTARLTADATSIGDGGRIIVWSDAVTGVHGAVSARGGIGGGNGGFLETSSRGYLEVSSIPDLVAPLGRGGTWLIDPANIEITNATLNITTTNLGAATIYSNNGNTPSTLNAATINGRLNAGISVIVDTSSSLLEPGDITVSAPITKTGGADVSLQLNANNDININQSITSTGGVLNIILNADSDATGGGAVNVGAVTLNANGGTIDATGKTVRFDSGIATIQSAMAVGDLVITNGTLVANNAVNAVTYTQSGGTLDGTGNVAVSGQTTFSLSSSSYMTGPGSLITLGDLDILGGIAFDAGRTLDVRGGATWNSGFITLNTTSTNVGSGRIINRAGSTFDITGDVQAFTNNFGPGDDGTDALFNNQGILVKSSGGGDSVFGARFTSSNALHVDVGVLILQGDSMLSGLVSVDTNGILAFEQGTHDLTASLTLGPSLGILRVGGSAIVTNAGALDLSGELQVLQTGRLNVEAGFDTVRYTQTGGTLAGGADLIVSGVTNLGSGSHLAGTGSLITEGALTISGDIGLDGGRTLDVRGGAFWGTTFINLNPTPEAGSGRIINRSGSLFQNFGDGQVLSNGFGPGDDGTDALFDNQGVFRKSGGGNATVIAARFNSTATESFGGGTVSLQGGGEQSGTIEVSGVLAFEGGTHTLVNVASLTSTGIIRVGGSGTVDTAGTFNHGGEIRLTAGGVLNANGSVTTATYTQDGGTLGGTGTVTVSGLTQLSGVSTLTGAGTLITQGDLFIVDDLRLDGGRTLEVRGGAQWHAGVINLNAGTDPGSGRIVNRSGSIFRSVADNSILAPSFGPGDDGGSAVFENDGEFNKAMTTTSTFVMAAFNNRGTVSNFGGDLSFQGDGTHTGIFTTGGLPIIAFDGGVHDLTNSVLWNANIRVGGSAIVDTHGALTGGLLEISGNGRLNAGAGITVNEYRQSNGVLAGPGDVTVVGAARLENFAFMTGTGSLIVQGALTIDGDVNMDGGRLLDIQGGANWLSGHLLLNAGFDPGSGRVINRAGSTIDVTGEGQMSTQGLGAGDDGTSARFDNLGTFIKTAGNFNAFAVTVQNDGHMEVQTGEVGMTAEFIQNGVLHVASGATLRTSGNNLTNEVTGRIEGAGLIELNGASLINHGIVAPGTIADPTGTLTISGSLVQQATGQLEIDLQGTGTGQYDILDVSSAAVLDGTLRVLLGGGYTPANGDAVTVLSAGSGISGDFASFAVPGGFAVQDLGHTLVLNFAPVSCPSTICWDNSTGNGLWSEALNWSTDVLPGSTDTVVIDLGGGTFILLTGGNYTIASILSEEHLEIASGFLTVTGAATFNAGLTVSSGSFAGFGDVQLDRLDITGGAFHVASTATINAVHMLGGVIEGPGHLLIDGSFSALAGGIAMNRTTGTIHIIQQSGDLNIPIGVQAASVVLETSGGGNAIMDSVMNDFGQVSGNIGGDLRVGNRGILQLGDGTANSLQVGGNLYAGSTAWMGLLRAACLTDSCVYIPNGVTAGANIEIVANAFDDHGMIRTGLGAANYFRFTPMNSDADLDFTSIDFSNWVAPNIQIGKPDGLVNETSWDHITIFGSATGANFNAATQNVSFHANSIDFDANLGMLPAAALPISFGLYAATDLNVGTGLGQAFTTIYLANGRNLDLHAGLGTDGGNLVLGGNSGFTLKVGTTGANTGSLALSGSNISIVDGISSTGVGIETLGSGAMTIDTPGTLSIAAPDGGNIWLAGGSQTINAQSMTASAGSNGFVNVAATNGLQRITLTGDLELSSGSSNVSAVEVFSNGGQIVSANSITLTGAGGEGRAELYTVSGNQEITTTGANSNGWGIELINNSGGSPDDIVTTISSGGTQAITVTDSNGVALLASNGGQAELWSSGNQTIEITGTGDNLLLLQANQGSAHIGANGTQNIIAGLAGEAGGIALTGGSIAGAHSQIFANGNQIFRTPGDIVLSGGNNTRAQILGNYLGGSTGVQDILANSISISASVGSESTGILMPDGSQTIRTTGTAGNGYGITIENLGATGMDEFLFGTAAYLTTRDGTQHLTAEQGGLLISGVGGTAIIDAQGDFQVIQVLSGSIDLEAGAGGAFIYFAGTSSQAIAADSISLSGGSANGAAAIIEATNGVQSVTSRAGLLSLTGGTAPGTANPPPDAPPGPCGDISACAVILARTGLQTIDANGIVITGGSGTNENLASIRGDAGQAFHVGPSGIVLTGGSGSGVNNLAFIESYGGSQVFNFDPGSSLSIVGGANGQRNFAGIWGGGPMSYSFVVQANTPFEHTVTVSTSGTASQQILGDVNISVIGGASGGGTGSLDPYQWRGNSAFIIAETGSQTLRAHNIAIGGGDGAGQNSAGIVAFGGPTNATAVIQDIQALGTITMEGGGAERTLAELTNRSTGIQSVVAGSLILEAGTGNFAFAEVKAGGTQNVTITSAGGALSLTGGSTGDDNYASVYNGAGRDQAINFQNGGSLTLIGGTSGNRNGAFIKAGRNQTINGNIDILLHGGGGVLAKAALEAAAIQRIGTSSVPVTGLEVFGGSGLDAAALVSAPAQEIWVAGDTSVGGGSGAGAFAMIGSTAGPADILLNTGSLGLTGGPGTAGTQTPYTALAIVGALGGHDADVGVVSAGNVTTTSSGASRAIVGSDTGGGAVSVESTGGDIFTDTITLVAGDTVTMAASGNMTVGIATARGGAVTLNSDGTLNLATALVSATGDIHLQSETEIRVGTGSTFAPGGGDVSFDTPSLFLASNFTLPSSGWGPTFERESMSIAGATLSTQLINQGTLTLANNSITAFLNNQGTINVASGVVDLAHGDGGSYNVAADATLAFGAGEYSLVSISGAGDVNVSGDVTLDTYSISGTTNLTGGYLTIEDSGSFGTLNMSDGIMDGTANLTAVNLNLTGGTLGGTGDLIVTGNFNHAGGTLEGNFHNLSLRHVGTFTVGNYNAQNNLTLAAAGGALVVNDVTVGASNVSLSGSSIVLAPGSSTGSRVNADNLTVSTPGSLLVDGTHGEAKLFASNSVNINAGSVTVRAGSFSAGIDPNTLTMNVDGNLVLQGGQGAQAVVAADNLDITAANILIEGGSIDGSYAGIIGGNGSSAIVALNGITLTPGVGLDSDAVIGSTGGPITLTTPSCSGCTILASDPIGNQALDTGLFGVPVTLTGTDLLPLIEVDNSIIYAATLAQDGGEANTEYKDDAEEDEDDDSGVTEEGGNDGKPKRSLPICI